SARRPRRGGVSIGWKRASTSAGGGSGIGRRRPSTRMEGNWPGRRWMSLARRETASARRRGRGVGGGGGGEGGEDVEGEGEVEDEVEGEGEGAEGEGEAEVAGVVARAKMTSKPGSGLRRVKVTWKRPDGES